MSRWTIRQWATERKWETRLAIGFAFFIGVMLGTIIYDSAGAARLSDTAPASSIARPLSVPSPVELSTTFAEVAQSIAATVVNINTETCRRSARPGRRRRQEAPDNFFDRFFDPQEDDCAESLGSGVIVDAKGFILTNYHVVEDADRIRVRLAGNTKFYEAEVVGTDRDTDLAVIKIEAGEDLPFAKLGNSEATKVGDWVLAIGSPFGLDATVTAGIISYKGRSGQELFDEYGQFKRYIQTDAAINRGNSGGPLVNMAGEIIGINTAIVSRRGVSAGVGFAMPSNTAIYVYNQILAKGRVVRGSIGIRFRGAVSGNASILRVYGADHGVMVQEVISGGPADRAGLEQGDIIIQVDDTPIHSGDDLIDHVTTTPVGKKVRLRYVRDRKEHDAIARVADFRAVHSDRYASEEEVRGEEIASAKIGVTLQDLTSDQAARFGLEEASIGPIVQEVENGSFASDIGLRRRDVIVEFNRTRVRSIREFHEMQAGLNPGDDVVFLVLRMSAPNEFVSLYLGGTLPEAR